MRALLASLAVLGALVACKGSEAPPDGPGPTDIAADAAPPSDVGRACTRTSECRSALCVSVQNEFEGQPVQNVCTTRCATDNDCVSGWSCRVGPTGVDVCQCKRSEERCDGRDNDCDGIIDNAPKDICACKLTICGDACIDTKTDPLNCGACGRSCGPNTQCAGGECRCVGSGASCDATKRDRFCGPDGVCHEDILLGGPSSPVGIGSTNSIAVGPTFVLFAQAEPSSSGGYHSLTRLSFNPSEPSTRLVFVVGGQMPGVAADGADFAFSRFTLTGGPSLVQEELVACPGGTCGAPILSGTGLVTNRLQLFGGKVYWLQNGELRGCALSGCGSPEVLGALPPGAVGAFVVDATGLYGIFGTTVAKWEQGSGVFTPLFSAAATHIAVDETNVFVATADGILRCAKAGCGGAATTIVTSSSPKGLAVRGALVHWVSGQSLFSCSKQACAPVALANGFSPLGAEDATHLYFASDRAVRRVSK